MRMRIRIVCPFLMKTKKRMSEMMVIVSTRIPQNSPVLALLQSRLYLLDSLSQSGGCLQVFRHICVIIFCPGSSFLLTCPCLFSRLRALSPLETCFHMMYRMAAHMRLYSMVHGNRKGELLSSSWCRA